MKNPRPKVFFFHYNKPASRAARKPLMSVHYNKKCYVVDHVECMTPCKTVHRKVQPFCVMKGKCYGIAEFTLPTGLTQITIL